MRIAILALGGLVLLAPWADTRTPPEPTWIAPIPHRVVDLLDDPQLTWTSEVFDTTPFSRIALEVTYDTNDAGTHGSVCAVLWQWSPEGPFVDQGGPRVVTSWTETVVRTNLVQVQGQRAKVRCECPEDGLDPPDCEGTLTDVRVLLRRW